MSSTEQHPSNHRPPGSTHPDATVPDRLFADDGDDQRWRQRFSAIRLSLADPARDAPDHAVYVSNANGRYELYCWDIAADTHSVATHRPDGTAHGTLSADGRHLLWFDDTDGDEFGRWQQQPFGGPPGSSSPAMPNVEPGYPAGLEVGLHVAVAGFVDDHGTRIHLSLDGQEPTVVYRNSNDGSVDGLSRDETIWLLGHSEHGDSRYPALRAIAVGDGSVIAELDDAPGKGLSAMAFSPIAGDQRVLVGHERHGRDQLLLWNVVTGIVTELAIDLPGDVYGDFYPDAHSLLIVHTSAGRTTMHRYQLATGALVDLPAPPGVISGAVTRPDGAAWYRWSSAAHHSQLRVVGPDGSDETLLLPPGGRGAGLGARHRPVGSGFGRLDPCLDRATGRLGFANRGRPLKCRPAHRLFPAWGSRWCRRGLLRRHSSRVAGRRIRSGARQLPRFHRLRLGLARRTDGSDRTHGAR